MVAAFNGSNLTNVDASQLDSQAPAYYLNYNNFTNTPTIPTNNNELTNGAGYITSADGGNAATLDSLDSTQFLRSDQSDTMTGDLTLTSTDAGATENPTLDLYRNSASPANSDVLGHILFSGETSTGSKVQYAEIESRIVDVTNGSEDGRLIFRYLNNGSNPAVIDMSFGRIAVYQDIKLQVDQDLYFQGSTDDSNETQLTVTDPTADSTITLPDATGTVLLDAGNQSITGDLTLTSTDAGSAEDPTLKLYRTSATPTGGDNIGHIQFTGNNASGTEVVLAEIESVLGGTTAGSEEGRMRLKVSDGGIEFTVIEIGYDRVQFNEAIFINYGRSINFEGTNFDNFETELNATEPTQDNTITLPDASGTVALQEQAYQAINAQTGTTYTTVLTDGGKLVTLSNASAITLTIPPNSMVAYPVGTKLDFIQIGAGQVTVAGGTGVTVNSTPTLKLRAQHSGASCVKIATDTWQLVGDLAAS